MNKPPTIVAVIIGLLLTAAGITLETNPAYADPGCTALFSASRTTASTDPLDGTRVYQSTQVYNTTQGCPRIHIGHMGTNAYGGRWMRVAWFGAAGIYSHYNWTWIPANSNYYTLYPGPLPNGLAYVLQDQALYGTWNGPPAIVQS